MVKRLKRPWSDYEGCLPRQWTSGEQTTHKEFIKKSSVGTFFGGLGSNANDLDKNFEYRQQSVRF
jgi:hypothetical protein